MTSNADVGAVARQFLRDFGTFFEINFAGALNSTLRLPHPLVDVDSLVVLDNATGDPVTTAALNPRQGILKLSDPGDHPQGVSVSGLYYQWFLPDDLDFHAQIIASEHLHNRPGVTIGDINGPEVEVLGIGCAVSALRALASELATDIDVATAEGVNIPAHQRYAQVLQLIQYWTAQYDEKAALLNIGLKRIETFELRRTSRLTNRLVPLYRPREVDDPRRPVRVRPPIDPIAPTPLDEEEAYWNTHYPDGDQASFDLSGGWQSIGSSGA